MPKFLCSCGEVVRYSDIPCKIQYLFISDVCYDDFTDLIDHQELYKVMKSFLKCDKCKRLYVYWNGFKEEPDEYVLVPRPKRILTEVQKEKLTDMLFKARNNARLKGCLDNLWSNVIDEMKVDVFNHRIMFKTRAIENGTVTNHQLTFEEVSSFYFVEGTGENRFNLLEPVEDSYLQLTSIDYHPKGIGLIINKSKTEDWVQQYISNSNFSIEIWSSMLFVEAKRVVINDIVFDVGYPQ